MAKQECPEIFTAKYQNRPSPPRSAEDCKYMLLVGNNGKEWRSMPNKNEQYRWIQTSRTQW